MNEINSLFPPLTNNNSKNSADATKLKKNLLSLSSKNGLIDIKLIPFAFKTNLKALMLPNFVYHSILFMHC